jgi:hypothetical protein
LVAQAGADFEDDIVGFELKQVRHHGNHQRLRDGFTEADRQGPVRVSVRLELGRHELMPRDFNHRPDHSLVQRSLADPVGNLVCVCRNRGN